MTDMQREEWLQLLLSELPERLFVLDQHGRFIESFGGTFHATRLNTDNNTNRGLSDLLTQESAQPLLAAISQTIESNQAQIIQYGITPLECLQLSIEELEDTDPEQQDWFEATIKPLCHIDGNNYVLWQERDITDSYTKQQELQRLSETDELTGILNRRAFLLALENSFKQAQTSLRGLTCLMVDIDHFKEINDQVGHLSGDEVITHVAHICEKQIRGSDSIGRLGGEEFGILLNNISAIQAYEIAERIRHSIEELPCHVEDKIIHPTVSIGIAEANNHITQTRELLIQADKAMYYSKQTGRNQVTIYHDNLPDMQTQTDDRIKILIAS